MADVSTSDGQAARPGILKMLRLGISYTPLITRVSLCHALNLAATSPYNDLRTAVTVAALRAFLEGPPPGKQVTLSKSQDQSLHGFPVLAIKGRMWISRYTCPAPPEVESISTAVAKAIQSQADGDVDFAASGISMPDVVPVEGEWTGYRPDVGPNEPPPNVSEEAKFAGMMKQVGSPVTILYMHGGGHIYMDPVTHRAVVKNLAKITRGRAFSVRYRLAPQGVFPTSLIDCLVAYLTLLFPPPGAFHEAVKPEHIVIAGDSAGANLALGLMQLIVDLNRMHVRISWHGESREIPVPAAVAGNSPWLDVTHSSLGHYGKRAQTFDYLGRLGDLGRHGFEPCAIWPANPPRKFIYAADEMITHPYVTSTLRRDWSGFPPMYFCIGWERLAYENKFLAQKMQQDGVVVVLDEYEAMPHCFALLMTNSAESKHCLGRWGGFITEAVHHAEQMMAKATSFKAKTMRETVVDFEGLSDVSADVVRQRLVDTVARTKAWRPSESRL